MLLGGSAPATWVSPGCDGAVVPVYNRKEISWRDNAGASQCALCSKWGQRLRKGFYHDNEKMFSYG